MFPGNGREYQQLPGGPELSRGRVTNWEHVRMKKLGRIVIPMMLVHCFELHPAETIDGRAARYVMRIK